MMDTLNLPPVLITSRQFRRNHKNATDVFLDVDTTDGFFNNMQTQALPLKSYRRTN